MSEQPTDSLPILVSAPPDRIVEFCRSVAEHHSEHWPVNEPVLADEFLTFFALTSFLTFENLAQFCRSRLRITISLASLPRELRGFNNSYGPTREIVIAADHNFPDAKLHTLLHELREIMEYGFQNLGSPTAQADRLECRAEEFASSVQISATMNLIPEFVGVASTIKKRWMRVGAYLLIFAGAIFYSFICANLPRIEDALAAGRSE